ncbi:GNAT family N-acetyltransferase [Flagellimonas nanhaiensis]|uniref:N-acetyltransferase n=1 Tax=Flagellimonas nanhaiensis TaxID=2292706 RepID=A0A371JU95_9FLAO|nr:GNAT family N-acetyltransferase [Allomuricauda nanhaiensis]RDY61380.1 N-acetyltransferase [Allomuricauda nanhaiensis]
MNQQIVDNLFGFWEEIADSGGFLGRESDFKFSKPSGDSWPSKVFEVSSETDLTKLKEGIKNGTFPNSIGVHGGGIPEQGLKDSGFTKTSSINAMAFEDVDGWNGNSEDFGIVPVDSVEKSKVFARVASRSFGCEVMEATVSSLYGHPSFSLFLGKHGDDYASCGIHFLDRNGISGLHMIGTLSEYRGFGLGKKMTLFLMRQAKINNSPRIYLVASKAGERIYTKLGFKVFGTLESYSL